MDKILIVDDMEMNRLMLMEMLEDKYEIVEAAGGKEALDILENEYQDFGCVLLDLIMPQISGYDVLDVMKKKKWLANLPVIVISGSSTKESEKDSLSSGASDYIQKPFDNTIVRRRVQNIVELRNYKRLMEQKTKEQEKMLKKQYGLLLQQAKSIKRNNERIIDVLGTVVEYRDLESGEHIERVKDFTEILAKEVMKEYPEYGLTQKRIEQIVAASPLHDIGKITIPDKILLKPGKLTKDEFEYMKSHTSRGSELLKQISGAWDDEFGEVCYEICRYHHEKYDGRGYPEGLKGEEIPISAQIVSVADVFDALVSERVYKNSYSAKEAFYMIITGECGVFSPKIMECFRKVRDQYMELVDKSDFD